MEPSPKVVQALGLTAEITGRSFSREAALLMAMDLAAYPEQAVLEAISRCRRELRGFPSIADILARVDDNRPGAEEAWTMIPHDEQGSVVWTQEMAEAFGLARVHLPHDPIAGRLAFREIYVRLVSDARANRVPVRWEASLGVDKHDRTRAVLDAVRKGRLTRDQALQLVPDLDAPAAVARITGPREESQTPVNVSSVIADIRDRIRKAGSP